MHRMKAVSAAAALAASVALILGAPVSASATTVPSHWSGTLTCGVGYPVVLVTGRSGTVNMDYDRRGDEFTIENTSRTQVFIGAAHNAVWSVDSTTLTSRPAAYCKVFTPPFGSQIDSASATNT